MYVKILNGPVAETLFLRNVDVLDGTAQTITDKLKQIFQDLDIPWSKVVCFSSDGASVMLGRINGVATKLRELNPAMVCIHCAGHRLTLAVSQATDGIAYFTRYKTNVKSMFNFFHYSAVRYNRLREIQDLFDERQVRITEWHSIRWLSLQKAVATIIKIYGPLVATLENEAVNNAVAKGIHSFITTAKFVLVSAVVLDVFKLVEPLNRLFQTPNTTFSTIKPLVSTTITSLGELKGKCGQSEGDILSDVKERKEFQGVKLQITSAVEAEYSNLKMKYLDNTIDNLEKRFPSEDTGVLSKFEILNPCTWPRNVSEINDFGKEELHALCTHYFVYICENSEDVLTEWLQFITMVITNYTQFRSSFTQLSELVHHHLSTPFPSINALYQLAKVLCISSADCERGFSTQNLIKTPKRSCMKEATLEHLQLIRLEGPPLEKFDFHLALSKWRTKKQRRF